MRNDMKIAKNKFLLWLNRGGSKSKIVSIRTMNCSLNKLLYTYDSLSEEPAIVSNVVRFCKTKHLVKENQYI